MEPKTKTETLLTNVRSVEGPHRDEVRNWIVGEQGRIRKQQRRTVLTAALAFAACTTMIWSLMNRQATEIRHMVKKNPSRSLICLQEVTKQLCDQPPAEYFVMQLQPDRSNQPNARKL